MENVSQEGRRGKSQTVVSYVTVKKKVQKVIQVPQLQGYFGAVDGDTLDPENGYVYFIKKFNSVIPRFSSEEEANAKMSSYFVVGSVTGNIFENMAQILKCVYVPLFRNRVSTCQTEETAQNPELEGVTFERRPSYYFFKSHVNGFLEPKDEFSSKSDSPYSQQLNRLVCPVSEQMWQAVLVELIDLINTVEWAQMELQSERKFAVPELINTIDWENFNINEEIETSVKNTVERWIHLLDSVFLCNTDEDSSCQDLLDEYEYWKEMEIKLSSAVDELNSGLTEKIKNILRNKYAQIYDEFNTKSDRLRLMFTDAKETADVLNTLLHFFKILTAGDFTAITKIIPTLIESLQSVWILSKYYSQEKNMERILLNIKNTLCRRVKSAFDVTTLFKSHHWNEMQCKLENAIQMLDIWKSSYLEVRARIESTRDYFISRWEFDKCKLFSETDYINAVIQDIRNIFKIIHHFQNLLVSKLKKFTERTSEFKNLESKIIGLPLPIEKVDFDIYLEIFTEEWQEILEIFDESVVEVDQRLKILIIKTFSQIKSVTEGIEVVEDLSKIQTRPTIHDSVPYICNKIIAQFAKEVKITDQIFEKNMSNNRGYKIYEFVSWGRGLVTNLRTTIVKLKTIAALSTTSVFEELTVQFENLNLKVENCILMHYKEWCKTSVTLVKEMLKENVVGIEEAEKSLNLKELTENKRSLKLQASDFSDRAKCSFSSSSHRKSELGFGSLALTLKWIAKSKINADNYLQAQRADTLRKIEQAHKTAWLEFVGNSLLIEKGFKFKLKLRNEIFDIVKDSECLQKDNFKLPKEIHEFLIMKNCVFEKIEKIKTIVTDYNSLIGDLEPAKLLLMKKYLVETEMAIQPGLTLYSWKCTVLDTYCRKASTKLRQLSCLEYQVREIFKKLDVFVASIENTNFLPLRNVGLSNTPCKDFFRIIDDLQMQQIENCVREYEMVSLALIQLESLILYTNSGRSQVMASFYTEYSSKILTALKNSILRSLSDMEMLFNGKLPVHFSIKSHLDNDKIKLQPTCDELFKFVKTTLIRMFTRLKWLKEWENGSCVTKKNSLKYFYQCLTKDEEIKQRSQLVLSSLQEMCNSLEESASQWLKYSILWKYDKNATIGQFAAEKPELSDYEFRFDFYSNMADKIEQEQRTLCVFCVNIEVEELTGQLKQHCAEWKQKLGFQLALDTKQMIDKITEMIQRLTLNLNMEIANYENLIDVHMSINEIERIAIDVSIEFYKIEEHYHELDMQSFEILQEDAEKFNCLKVNWEKLYDAALYKKFVLEPAKMAVTDAMKNRIVEFVAEYKTFLSEYNRNMVKLQSSDFDIRVEFIVDYSNRCLSLYKKKLELMKVHESFEIAPIEFQDFVTVKMELDKLRIEYRIT